MSQNKKMRVKESARRNNTVSFSSESERRSRLKNTLKRINYWESIDTGNKLQFLMQKSRCISILVPRDRRWKRPQCSSED